MPGHTVGYNHATRTSSTSTLNRAVVFANVLGDSKAELFEARRPKDAAVIAEISGKIEFGRDYKNKRRIKITPEPNADGVQGEPVEFLIPKGKHISVHDGDTLRARTRQGDLLTIRIAGIDAPELGQPFGRESRVLLAAAIAEDPVDLDCFSTDRYFRRICRIRSRGRDIALEQVMTDEGVYTLGQLGTSGLGVELAGRLCGTLLRGTQGQVGRAKNQRYPHPAIRRRRREEILTFGSSFHALSSEFG